MKVKFLFGVSVSVPRKRNKTLFVVSEMKAFKLRAVVMNVLVSPISYHNNFNQCQLDGVVTYAVLPFRNLRNLNCYTNPEGVDFSASESNTLILKE